LEGEIELAKYNLQKAHELEAEESHSIPSS